MIGNIIGRGGNARYCLAEFRGCFGRKANIQIRVAKPLFKARVYRSYGG